MARSFFYLCLLLALWSCSSTEPLTVMDSWMGKPRTDLEKLLKDNKIVYKVLDDGKTIMYTSKGTVNAVPGKIVKDGKTGVQYPQPPVPKIDFEVENYFYFDTNNNVSGWKTITKKTKAAQ